MKGVSLERHRALPLLALVALGCGAEGDGGTVTYAKDVKSLFTDCVLCHQPAGPFGPIGEGPDVLDPYAAPDGLAVSVNHWKKNHPETPVPAQVVVPGQPDDSFLINKISDPALGLLPPLDQNAGTFMPFPIERITPDELARVEQWVTSGAQDDDFYRTQVATIFLQPNGYTPGKCDVCHFKGSAIPMDIKDPFGPDGMVGIKSEFRSDLLRIAPGDPDGSLVVQRMRQSAGDNLPTSEFGAPMPKPTPLLSDAQVAVVRQWIVDGAKP